MARTTEDGDILIQATEENCQRVIDAWGRLGDAGPVSSLRDILDNLVVKVGDEVQVDISTKAWKVSNDAALAKAKDTLIDVVRIPFVGLDDLVASKETTWI